MALSKLPVKGKTKLKLEFTTLGTKRVLPLNTYNVKQIFKTVSLTTRPRKGFGDQFGDYLGIPLHSDPVSSADLYIKGPHHSWRWIIWCLDHVYKTSVADELIPYTEPPADPSLTVERVTPIFLNLKEWAKYGDIIVVPDARADVIRTKYSSIIEQQAQAAFYYVNCYHNASWSQLAMVLYRCKQSAAIKMFKSQLPKPQDPTLTPENVLAELQKVQLWGSMESRDNLNMPPNTHDDLIRRHGDGAPGKSALVNEYLSQHPYPRWDQIVRLLEWMDRKGKARAGLAQEVKDKYMTMTDEEALTIVEKALESGSLKQRNAVTVVTGIMGSGKTWLLSRLFRIKPPGLYTSTGVAEESRRGLMRHIGNVRSFELLTPGQILDLYAPQCRAGMSEVSQVHVFIEMQGLEYSPHLSKKGALTFPHVPPPTTASPRSSSPSRLDESLRDVAVSPSEESPSRKALKGLVQKAESSKEALVLELMHMIDTGGQPEFMEVMPCLIHNSNLTILVLDVSINLDAYPTLTFNEDDTTYEKKIVLSRTNRQIIQQLVSTMQAKRGKKKDVKRSKFLVIGTHIDCVDKAKLSEVLSALNKELKAIFLPMMEKELIVYKNEIVHAVNLCEPDDDDEKLLDCVRSSILCADIGVEMDTPLCLFMFEQDAIKYAEEQKGKGRHVMVLSLEECLQVGARLKMNRKMVQAALIYFHRHNVFLYFRHILPNLVFLDPRVPLDFVNAIVRFSYKAKNIQSLTAQQLRFCNEGILTEELLQHECLSTSFVPNLYEPRHALDLFQHIFTIAPLSEDSPETEQISPTTEDKRNLPSKPAQKPFSDKLPFSLFKMPANKTKSPSKTEPVQSKPLKIGTAPGKAEVERTEYLMMCLLPDKTRDETVQYLLSYSQDSPLLVVFSNNCAPNGSFGNTISCLITTFHWKVAKTSLKPDCLAHNVVTLRPDKVPIKVTLVNSTRYFEIHVKAKNAFLEKYCRDISFTIFAAVTKVFDMMQFDDIDVEPAFLCPCGRTPAHAATIFIEEATLECSQMEEDVGELELSQKIWHAEKLRGFRHQSPPIKERLPATEDQPALPQLIYFKTSKGNMNLAERIGTSYDKFGVLLLEDDDGAVTQSIRDEYQCNAAKINYEILQRWIQGKGRLPVRWSTLIIVLKEMKLSRLAKEIEDNLQ